ncbi:hypothetical protein WMY93_022342 [Mugilogobius chulae]|uniref:Uncharacterized protein n=1 Tax=Mugilogobius chulae TaxID=88201 RepID=A0AAW0N6P4_9GOBI
MVTEREALVKKLVDDKKFYQLELVNRETGFGKVFNASATLPEANDANGVKSEVLALEPAQTSPNQFDSAYFTF